MLDEKLDAEDGRCPFAEFHSHADWSSLFQRHRSCVSQPTSMFSLLWVGRGFFLFSFHLLNPESNAIKPSRPLGRLEVASAPLSVTLIELALVPALFLQDEMRDIRDPIDVKTNHSDRCLYRAAEGSGNESQEVVAHCVSFGPGNAR